MTRPLAFALLLLLAGVLAFASEPRSVRAETRVVESTVENGYPENITFHLRAEADVEITDITLTYTITGRGSSGLGKPDDFTPAAAVDVSVGVNVGGANLIPVGSEFSYTWAITTADGETLLTPAESFLFLPPDREWQTLESDIMRVYYHGNREESARELLIAGEETYQRMAVELLQSDLEVKPVKLILFVNEEEMDPAREGRSSTLDALTQTCGLKVTNDVIFVIQSCNSIDTTDVLRHELTHIINDAAGQGALGVMPAWLDEGTAVYAQSTLGAGFQSAITLATRTGDFIPFADMPLPASDPNLTNLFYGQAWAMVDFLIKREGPEEFARFFGLLKEGTRYDRAIEEVYGFDLAGFEAEFLAAMGAAPQQQGSPTATPGQANPTPSSAQPTRVPIATSNTDDGDDGAFDTATILIVGAAVIFGLIAVFAYLLSSMLAANRKAAAASTAAVTPVAEPRADTWDRPLPPPGSDGDSLLTPPGSPPPTEPPERDQPRV